VLDDIDDPIDDISLVTGLPPEVVKIGLEKITESGTVTICDNRLVVPNFLEAQEASKSDKQRQRESRERRRVLAMVTNCDSSDTKGDNKSQAVTPGHEESQPVTLTSALPSCALPSSALPTPKKTRTRVQYNSSFEEFWKLYPYRNGKKTGKADAFREFKAALKRTNLDTIVAAVKQQCSSAEWQKKNGAFVPDAHRWLKKSRWEDEITAAPKEGLELLREMAMEENHNE
jgi:hypothetical protein